MTVERPNLNLSLTKKDAQAILSSCLGKQRTCTDVTRLHAGKCYAVFRLAFDVSPHKAVIKVDVSPENEGFKREKTRLALAGEFGFDLAPQIYGEDSARTKLPFSYLLLEALEGTDLESASVPEADRDRISGQLADALLELHSHTRRDFGEIEDKSGERDWRSIFLPRLNELRDDMQSLLEPDVLADLDGALEPASDVLGDTGLPTLVHGDVWAGNILVVQKDDGWHLSGLVDWPAFQYADVEYELAYLEAWNTVTSVFFEHYTKHKPLHPGYERRRLFYWLHTYMLHVWLHEKDQYRQMVAQTARRITEVLKE